MNIFAVNSDPRRSAECLADKHVVKMIVESAQILVTALDLNGFTVGFIRPTHRHHPCVKWAAATGANFLWLCDHGQALSDEYTTRYARIHAYTHAFRMLRLYVDRIPAGSLTQFALAMPDEFKGRDPHVSYRRHLAAKYEAWGSSGRRAARWKRNQPDLAEWSRIPTEDNQQ